MRIAGTQVSGTVKQRRREHFLDDCDEIGTCNKIHRIMSWKAEADLMRYPGEWVMYDKREGVKYHGPDAQPIFEQARADLGEGHGLVLYRVPNPNVAYFL